MRIEFVFLIVAMCSACTVNGKKTQHYYFVEPFKEQEIKLALQNDSTFSFKDLTGCNQFEFEGHYSEKTENAVRYLLFDSVKFQKILPYSSSEQIFFLKNGDTAWILNDERIFIQHQAFIATSSSKTDLQKIRYNMLEEYYTEMLGRRGFIQIFGNGKGKKEAKKRLLDCKLPDIKLR